ncbi:MAG: hypothetical protein HC848_10675 [Limnobacter sp.]|nr:hypothetical protein [Limnobacter sp.]
MVPEGWQLTELGSLASFASGNTPSKSNSAFWNGAYPWVSAKDLKTDRLESSLATLTEEGYRVAKKAPQGSTLLLVRGMMLLKNLPVAYATRELAFNQDLKALVPHAHVDGLFLSYLLQNEKHKLGQLVSTAGHGTGRLDTDSIKQFPVCLPPLPEQQKIARILSVWDEAIHVCSKLLHNSRQQREGLRQQLLSGKMRFPQDVAPWQIHTLGQAVVLTMGASPQSSAYNHTQTGLPLVQGRADIKNGVTSPRFYTTQTTKTCQIGDVLLSVRAPVGAVALSLHHAA